jgi:hypothetical protein
MVPKNRKVSNNLLIKVTRPFTKIVKGLELIERIFLFSINSLISKFVHKSDYYKVGILSVCILTISELFFIFHFQINNIITSLLIVLLFLINIIRYYKLKTEDYFEFIKLKSKVLTFSLIVVCWSLIILNFYIFFK